MPDEDSNQPGKGSARQQPPTDEPAAPRPAPDEDFFGVEHLQGDLRGRSVRGAALTAVTQGTRFVVRLGALAILARLLTPADFGLIAMATAITGLAGVLKDLGLGTSTVQHASLTRAEVSTLFWINGLVGLALMSLIAAIAPLVAWFYDEPRLVWVTLALAPSFLVSSAAIQHYALLQRQMRYGALTVVQVTGLVIGNVVAVAMALAGAGYWSLLAPWLVPPLVTFAGVWIATGWRPGPPRRRTGVRKHIRFGANLTGARLLAYLSRNMDNILIGWRWGAGPLGYYTRAYQLLLLPISQLNYPLTNVAIPALSRLQNDPQRFTRFYRRAVNGLVSAAMPLVAFSIVAADEIVLLVLGPQWERSVWLFRLLGVAAFSQTLNATVGWLFLSLGQTDRQLRMVAVASGLVIIAFVIGLPWGAEGVAIAYSAAEVLRRPFLIMYSCAKSPVRPSQVGGAIWRPGVAAIGAGAATWALVDTVFPEQGAWLRLSFQTISFAGLYLGLWWVLPGGSSEIRGLLTLRRDLLSRG